MALWERIMLMKKVPFYKSNFSVPDIPQKSLYSQRIHSFDVEKNRLSVFAAPESTTNIGCGVGFRYERARGFTVGQRRYVDDYCFGLGCARNRLVLG